LGLYPVSDQNQIAKLGVITVMVCIRTATLREIMEGFPSIHPIYAEAVSVSPQSLQVVKGKLMAVRKYHD